MQKKLLIFLGFLSIAFLWFFKEAFQGFLFCFSDLTFYFYPYRFIMAQVVRLGQIPLWNPYLMMGFPFLGVLQPGVFYPLSLLYYLLPYDLAFSWYLIIHFPLMAFFMYLLCRDLKMSTGAAFIAGLVLAFSGYTLSVLHMPTTLAAITWLPLVFLFLRRFWLIPLIISLVLMFLGGEPTIIFLTGWLMLGYLLVTKWGRWAELSNKLGWLIVVGLGVIGLSAVQLFPFLELLLHSSREGGISFVEASYFSLEPRKLIEFILPYFFHLTRFPWVEMGWIKVPYLGLIPFVLSLIALFLAHSRRVLWLGLLGLISILLVLGANAPVPIYYLLFKFIPGFNLVRYPVKFLFIFVFIMAYLDGLSLDLLWQQRAKLNRVLIILSGFVVGLGSLWAWAASHSLGFFALLKPLFIKELSSGMQYYIKEITMPRNIANLGIATVLMAVLLLVLTCAKYNKLRRSLFSLSLVVLIFFDLYTAIGETNFSVKSSDYQKTPAMIELIKKDQGLFRHFVAPTIYKRSHDEISSEFENYDQALLSMRSRLTANQNMLYSLADIDGYKSIRGADHDKMIQAIYNLNDLKDIKIFNLLNVKYLITPWPFRQKGFTLIRKEKEKLKKGNIYLYLNDNVLPRAFMVQKAKVIADRDKLFDYLFNPDFEPKREILLEQHEQLPQARSRWQHKSKIAAYKMHEVIIETDSNQAAFLFLSDWYYPGWKVYVDGQPAKILRANFMFRAVKVAKGQHTVCFVYQPFSFKLGLLVSLLTIMILVVIGVYKFNAKR